MRRCSQQKESSCIWSRIWDLTVIPVQWDLCQRTAAQWNLVPGFEDDMGRLSFQKALSQEEGDTEETILK